MTALTPVDREMLARIEALYGPVARTPAHETVRATTGSHARRPSLARTLALVALAAALIVGTDSGRTMYSSLRDEIWNLRVTLTDVLASR